MAYTQRKALEFNCHGCGVACIAVNMQPNRRDRRKAKSSVFQRKIKKAAAEQRREKAQQQ